MKIILLSNIYHQAAAASYKESNLDTEKVGGQIKLALESFGHQVDFEDVNELTFEKFRRLKPKIVFNASEGFNGRSDLEPHVASVLELLDIPYTGSGPFTLSLSANKPLTKAVLMHYKIPTPPYQVFTSPLEERQADLIFPLIVKPISTDSSEGIGKGAVVTDDKQLMERVRHILETHHQPAMAEKFISGREFTVSILGNGGGAEVLPAVEAVYSQPLGSTQNICDYSCKWKKYSSSYKNMDVDCPAKISGNLERKLGKIALKTHMVLGAKDYSRVDIRLDEKENPYVLELNANPSLAEDCFLNCSAKVLNIKHFELINIVFNCALERYGLVNDRPATRIIDFKKKQEN